MLHACNEGTKAMTFCRYSKKEAQVLCNLCCRKYRGIIGFIVSA